MIIRTNCYVKEKEFVTREIAGETIIVPVKGNVGDLNSIYTLNEIGTMIWQLIDGKKNVGQIIKVICSAYEVTPEEAEKDTVDFLKSLEEAGLIRRFENDRPKGP
jgi:hypothetical protein